MKILIANDKGGVGKSTLAQYFVVRLRRAVGPVRIVEWDFQPKLHRFFGRDAVQTFGLQIPTSSDEHLGEVLEHFDPIVKWLQVTRPCVVDFGAQGWHQFAFWAELTGLRDLVRTSGLTIVSPLTADIESLDGVSYVVDAASRVLPGARVVVPVVLKDGDVACFKGLPAYERLQDLARAGALRFATVPRLPSEGYAALASRGLTFDEIEASDAKALLARAPLNPMAAARALKGVRDWLAAVDGELGKLLPMPAAEPVVAGPAVMGAD
ncbi:MAG: hypothetical protein RLO51_24490 [Thalassobaculum sp.]|uniref:hypothetical protein n=1 Tax=Thalassobaculum sp. TaxID=2022740 RepID=UPI0032EB259B